ncbi:unnamed protein product [Arabidopsis lyrata]|uniref:Transmembrane protein n=1 Tax=Arabidopsis lyrata subsp. lyrata TaxID=81972 RepID=D7KE51_ARALL|nr:uncharacterized protein LOC9325578 [Arabidopsis lyrata subsp. lyrata]EFH65773.1 hypothetical protein ARALYDRAFT_470437 [Arabidopsis lyrata subsp. lyrata]CAH8251150.1 unnamed protein product [Arabidopsis lyrata]|eukprot:XP_020869409.1 uncharacterized protein LOC9325578 [Arabidopsis lyrata subsp. lyrata]
MDHQWRMRFSFKNATIALTVVNVLIFLFLLQGFFTSSSSSSSSSSSRRLISAQLRYIKEAEEIRLKMQPLELIKRVREIEQEASAGQETEQHKDVKQTTAVDLSKRLKDFRALNDASSLKALEEWRKRKMERARQRDLEKTGGVSSIKTSS